jgi:Indole-3-glycerol phosphate synthase
MVNKEGIIIMNILEEIAEKTEERIKREMRCKPLEELEKEAYAMETDTGFPFERAVKEGGLSFICEVKKASPSKGVIAEEFPYVQIAKEYEFGGASAVSVLTEPFYFMGSDNYLREIKKEISLPVLRKDFTINEYMVYQAKVMGADAILLICAILNDTDLNNLLGIAGSLGLSALVEAHDEEEVKRAVKAGARLVGVNNRDLKTFQVDINNSLRLRKLVPEDIIFVSESGIQSKEDIMKLAANGTDGVLIGETVMRAGEDRVSALKELCALAEAEGSYASN